MVTLYGCEEEYLQKKFLGKMKKPAKFNFKINAD